MDLISMTRPELVFPQLRASDAGEVLETLAGRLAERGVVADPGELLRKLREREELGSTGIGSGVAIPHCKLTDLSSPLLAIGICSQGVDFAAVDGQPVRLFFLVVSPADAPAVHLQALAAISRWVKHDRHVDRVLQETRPEAILEILDEP